MFLLVAFNLHNFVALSFVILIISELVASNCHGVVDLNWFGHVWMDMDMCWLLMKANSVDKSSLSRFLPAGGYFLREILSSRLGHRLGDYCNF